MRSLLLLWVALAGCGTGTTLLIATHVTGDTALEQLRYQAHDEQGLVAFGPQTRPEVASGRQPSSTAVRVLLPDANAGQVIEVFVEGLIAQRVVLEGRALVRIELGREAEVTVELLAPGSACSGCPGCCSAGACLSPSTSACGAGCATCEPPASDSCRADGSCGCGSDPPCGAGVHCLGGACRCDASTCAGCCSAMGQCLGGDSKASCGAGGSACQSCARRCSGGACD